MQSNYLNQKEDVAELHYYCGLIWWALLMINDKKIISIDIHVLKQKRHGKFVNQHALHTGQFRSKLIKT